MLHRSSSELSFGGGEEEIDVTGEVTRFEEILVGFVFELECMEITGSDDEVGVTGAVNTTGEAGAAPSAWAAWWRAARRRFFSLSAGPRWRGRQEGEEVGGEVGGEKAGMEWGAPGCPRVQVKLTVVRPSLVERLREAFPPWAQTERNSVTDATTNCEFDLEDISLQEYLLIS